MNVGKALVLAREKVREDAEKERKKEEERVRKELRAARAAAKAATEVTALKHKQTRRRAHYFGESVDEYLTRVRPLRERRAVAKLRAQQNLN